MIDVALLGRTPRLDADVEEDITVDCFRFRFENESNNIDEGSTTCDGPLAIICERGVCPLNSVVYGWQRELTLLCANDIFLEEKSIFKTVSVNNPYP